MTDTKDAVQRARDLRKELLQEYQDHVAKAKEIKDVLWEMFRVKAEAQKLAKKRSAKRAAPPQVEKPDYSKKIAALRKRLEKARASLVPGQDPSKNRRISDKIIEIE